MTAASLPDLDAIQAHLNAAKKRRVAFEAASRRFSDGHGSDGSMTFYIDATKNDVPGLIEDNEDLLALVRSQQAQIATAKSDALREAAEHFKARSDTYHKTMQEMADSREYGVEDIVRYGAYSAEAQTTATWLRTRAALTAAEATA